MANNKYVNTLIELSKSERFYDCAITPQFTHSSHNKKETSKPCYSMSHYANCGKCILSRSTLKKYENVFEVVRILEQVP